MDILITFDANYILPFKVMAYSLFAANPQAGKVTFYLLHSGIDEAKLADLHKFCGYFGAGLLPIRVERALFREAPTNKRYPQEMYYRLLAPLILPGELQRVLYLDPDILVINPFLPLWQLDMRGKVFAAASHSGLTNMVNEINFTRLNIDHVYFNSGVMLIDLVEARQTVRAADIFQCVQEYDKELLLPDQDVFNILYGGNTLAVDDEIWNYDVRKYQKYLVRSGGRHDRSWLMQHGAVLHFCGRNKPWRSERQSGFYILYKHYLNLTQRLPYKQ